MFIIDNYRIIKVTQGNSPRGAHGTWEEARTALVNLLSDRLIEIDQERAQLLVEQKELKAILDYHASTS